MVTWLNGQRMHGVRKESMAKVVAYALWALKVGPGLEWDHKRKVLNDYRMFSHDAPTKRLYMYDIWSNIHYGYVGAAIYFTLEELTVGAGVANVFSSYGKSLAAYGQMDDPRDQAAILLGIELWSRHGASLSIDTFVAAVRDCAPALTTFECSYVAKLA